MEGNDAGFKTVLLRLSLDNLEFIEVGEFEPLCLDIREKTNDQEFFLTMNSTSTRISCSVAYTHVPVRRTCREQTISRNTQASH